MQNMQEIIETVAARYERGDYSHVMEICEGVLRSGRDDWQLLHFLAKAAYQLGNFPQAQGYARRAVTQAPPRGGGLQHVGGDSRSTGPV
jgi:Flp pilus assembly protein TadD